MKWPIATLADVTDVITKGTTPTSIGYGFADSGIPFLRAQNLLGGRVSLGDDALFVSADTHAALARSQIQPNDVLISIAGTIGRAALVQSDVGPLNCNQAVAIVRPKADVIHPPFLRDWLSSWEAQRQITGAKVTATISNLSLGQIGELQLPLPPLPEQKRIAAILDKADAIRRKRQQAIELTENLLRSAFLEMFGDPLTNPKGWDVRPLGDLVRETRLGLVRASADQGPDREYGYVRMDSIGRNGLLDLNRVSKVDASVLEAQSCSIKQGDLLFNTRNTKELVGKTAVYRGDGSHLFNNNIMRIRFREGISSDFVNFYLLSQFGQRELNTRKAGTTSVFAIYFNQLATLPVQVPPSELQAKYTDFTTRALETRDAANAHSAFCTDLGQVLMQEAFMGQL